MANDERCNCNNGDNNVVQNPPSTLEQLLIVQAQLLQTTQQLLVQMQDVNQLLQSMQARPSSVKRKSNTQDDVGPTSRINATEKVAPNHKEGSMPAKATTTSFNCGQVDHFANQCPEQHQCPTPTLHPNNLQILNVGSPTGQKSQATMDANPVRADRKCYNCGERGHYAHQCPNTCRQSLIQQAMEKEKVHPED
jgi:hypothetical protein